MPNRLALESSPYLLQHADNPVDWHPWGESALALAHAEDKPILLSVGYAACHWCHVMAHESFEDAETARLMNQWFINVKVDREERPDIDAIYMRAVQALTRQGGWPMTVFLTPEGVPFYGGTYFPPEDRHGIPAFRRVLGSVADAWRTRRADVTAGATALLRVYDEPTADAEDAVDDSLMHHATHALMVRYDRAHGGFGGAPKFPPTMSLDFLLRRWARTGDAALLHAVSHSWHGMARGGLYDQLGGGFHRYTVDDAWLVPHFEKMLYDNALLVRLGAHLWQATGDAAVRATTEQTLAWVVEEMTAPGGGFYASLDADSEGHEGRFYVWTLAELQEVLGADTAMLAAYWGASPSGNFEGRNILWCPQDDATFAAKHRVDPAQLADTLARGSTALLAARAARERPARDDKIIASWNGLMLRGVAECARIFGDTRWQTMALTAAEFLATELVRDGRASRVFAGGAARIAGFLEDHAALGLGFLSVYELTFDPRWLRAATEMADACERHFWDDATGAFYDAAADAPPLITRPRDAYDHATPSGTSLAVELLQRVGAIDGQHARRERAARVLSAYSQQMAQASAAFGHLLGAADAEANGDVTVVLAGTPDAADFTALTRAVAATYVPGLVLAGGSQAPSEAHAGKASLDGRAAAYVCRGFACDAPTTEAATLSAQLHAITRD
ncbi:MAG: thioredoxin domain-containing protein [Gemmatimonadota bacterium]|nr:thioredoxin domain-containing protein [Gemmatimonadota bacterium]